MIFNEVYSAYYNTVAKILEASVSENADEESINRIVSENAFGESVLTVLPSLKNEKWQLLHEDMTTPIKNIPTMPLTKIQKMWLKAISLDKRIKLFGCEIKGLKKTEPLFTEEDYYIYDKYSDGDPYDDEGYIENFRTILRAIKDKQNLKIEMTNRKGNTVYSRCVPERLEYSEKDDKFRLITSGCHFIRTINLARITKCRIYQGEDELSSLPEETDYETITLEIRDERNTLERCLLHFAHFEKRAEKADDRYILHIRFHRDDEPEMVIRVLSFGPTVKVTGSEAFRNLIINKLKSQKSCELS